MTSALGEPWLTTPPPTVVDDPTRPRLLHKAEMRPGAPLPKSELPGYKRIRFSSVHGRNSFCSLVEIPPGERTPSHESEADHLIIGVTGAVDFLIDGDTYRVTERDVLFIPAATPYRYMNGDGVAATFFSVVSRSEAWPPRSRYWDD